MTGENQESNTGEPLFAGPQTFTLQTLSELSGFPIELIKKELLFSEDLPSDTEMSLDELRMAMLKYLDLAMLGDKQ